MLDVNLPAGADLEQVVAGVQVRQHPGRGRVEAVGADDGLDPSSAGVLANLATGHHLLKIGSRREIHVEHVRSTVEKVITNTDSAMMLDGRGRGL